MAPDNVHADGIGAVQSPRRCRGTHRLVTFSSVITDRAISGAKGLTYALMVRHAKSTPRLLASFVRVTRLSTTFAGYAIQLHSGTH